MAENPTAVADDINEDPPVQEKPASGKKWLWISLVLLVLLGGAGGAGVYFMTAGDHGEEAPMDDAAAKAKGKPYYLQLEPGFVVNLSDPDYMRYLQVDVEVMTRDEKLLTRVEEYMPEMRNRLLLLFAQQKYEQLLPRSGKEALQQAALEEINKVLNENGVEEAISAVYFTSFVMQ